MQREIFIDRMVDWLNRRVAPDGVIIDADTRLFESGIIDSLGILRLIAWTEVAIGREIQDREVRMDRFGSVSDIATHFLAGDGSAGGLAGCGVAAEGGFAAGNVNARANAACARCGRCARRAA